MAWLSGWSNRLELTIDHERIDEDLTNFPVLVTLGSGVARNNFDATVVFDELVSFTTLFEDDFSSNDGYGWYVQGNGTINFINDQVEGKGESAGGSSAPEGETLTSGTYNATDWKLKFDLSSAEASGGDSISAFYWNYSDNDNKFYVIIQRYSGYQGIYFGQTIAGVAAFEERLSTTDPGNDIYSFIVGKRDDNFYIKYWRRDLEQEPSGWNLIFEDSSIHRVSGQILIRFEGYSDWSYCDNISFERFNYSYDKKIAITDYTGNNQLPVEIEYWNMFTENANLWTKVPTITSGTDTTIYLYYDVDHLDNDVWVGETNTAPARAVWDEYFEAVFHMHNFPTGSSQDLKESTSNIMHATTHNMEITDLTSGFIGNAVAFGGTNEYAVTDAKQWGFSTINTFELMLKTDGSGPASGDSVMSLGHSPYTDEVMFLSDWSTAPNKVSFFQHKSGGNWWAISSNNNITDNEWHYVVGTMNGTGFAGLGIFIDGQQESGTDNSSGSPTAIVDSTPRSLYFAIRPGGTDYGVIALDEVRVSSVVRSDAWIKATWYSNSDDLMSIALGGTAPPAPAPELPWQEDWANFYEITIDKDRIDENLGYFPLLITLSSGVGINNFDATGIFDHLATASGVDNYTSFMMPTDGDRSISKHDNIAFAYNPIITTVDNKSCLSLNGSDQCIIVLEANHPDWSLGLDDFTLEAWINSDSYSGAQRIISHGNLSVPGEWTWGIGSPGGAWGSGFKMNFAYRESGFNTDLVSEVLTYSLGTWHHVALTRESGTLYFFLDGTLSGTASANYDLTAAGTTGDSEYLMLGARAISSSRGEFFPGYQTRWAVHKGIARWTSDFTPSEYPINDQYTKFLYRCDGDGSQYKHNLQMISDPEVHSSDPATNSHKAYWYFDADGTPSHDQITVPHHSSLSMGGSDFTIEFYFKTISNSATRYLLTKRTGIPYANFNITHATSGYVTTSLANSAGTNWQISFTGGQAYAPTGEWVYYTLTREGSTARIYINGVLVYVGSFSGDLYDDGGPMNIGGRGDGTLGHYGYIQGLRISKDTAKYTSWYFTPPDPPDGDSWVNRRKIQVADSNYERLYTEIERWDHTNKKAWLWTKIPAVSSSEDTTLYLYYDKTQNDNTDYVGDTRSVPATKVWSDNFNAVWHMVIHDYSGANAMLDSTINGNDLSTGGFNYTAVFQMVDGLNTPAINFDSINDYFTITDNSTLDLTTNYTIEAMFRPTANDLVDQIICKASNDSNGYQLRGNNGTGPSFNTGTGGIGGRANWQSYGWQYASAVCAVTGTVLYLDGEYHDSGSTTGTPNNASNFYIGRRWDSYYFDGQISEIRLSTTPRSASYAKANYYNMWDNLLTFEQGMFSIFTCSGIVTVNGAPFYGVPVRLYRRSTGELIDSAYSGAGGLFAIDSPYNEEHYILALYTVSGTNALIYDRIHP